jgi:hypothetical protein
LQFTVPEAVMYGLYMDSLKDTDDDMNLYIEVNKYSPHSFIQMLEKYEFQQ